MPEPTSLPLPGVDVYTHKGKTLVMVIRRSVAPDKTVFLTGSEAEFQAGFVYRDAGGEIQSHLHRGGVRTLSGTSEVLLVREGRCEMDVFSDDKDLIGTCVLETGDIVLIQAGGHGFRMLEKTTFFEIKQGPFLGASEKDRF